MLEPLAVLALSPRAVSSGPPGLTTEPLAVLAAAPRAASFGPPDDVTLPPVAE
jgi:hypothetical protein